MGLGTGDISVIRGKIKKVGATGGGEVGRLVRSVCVCACPRVCVRGALFCVLSFLLSRGSTGNRRETKPKGKRRQRVWLEFEILIRRETPSKQYYYRIVVFPYLSVRVSI